MSLRAAARLTRCSFGVFFGGEAISRSTEHSLITGDCFAIARNDISNAIIHGKRELLSRKGTMSMLKDGQVKVS